MGDANDLLDNNLQKTVLTNPHIGDIHLAMFYDYAIRFNSDNNLTPDKVTTIVSDFQYRGRGSLNNIARWRVATENNRTGTLK